MKSDCFGARLPFLPWSWFSGKWDVSKMSFLSFSVIFHFHDYGRKTKTNRTESRKWSKRTQRGWPDGIWRNLNHKVTGWYPAHDDMFSPWLDFIVNYDVTIKPIHKKMYSYHIPWWNSKKSTCFSSLLLKKRMVIWCLWWLLWHAPGLLTNSP